MDTTPRFEAMSTGTLLDRAFHLYKANFALMLGITAVAYVPFELINLAIELGLDISSLVSNNFVAALLYFFVYITLWSSIAFPIAGGAATYAISERYLGNEVAISAALRRGLSCFWTLSLAELVASIRMIFGLLLLLVPGIVWMLSYALIVPVILVEKQSAMASLRRSRELMDGHRGKAFWIMLVLVLLQGVLIIGIGMITGWIFPTEAEEETPLNPALNALVSILIMPLYEIAAILLYYDARIRKEGFDLEMLGRAFSAAPQSLEAVASR